MTSQEKAAILHARMSSRFVGRVTVHDKHLMIQVATDAWDSPSEYFQYQMSHNERVVALSVVRAIGDENWIRLESEILPISLKSLAASQLAHEGGRGVRSSRLTTYEDYFKDQGLPNARLDDTLPPYSSFDVKAVTAYGLCSHPEEKLKRVGPSNKNGLPLLQCRACGESMYGYLSKELTS